MFEKFTEGAIKILMAAQEEARRMGHNHVGTEQLMLAIIGQRRGIAGIVLSTQGIKLKAFRREVEKLVGRGRGFLGLEVPFTPRAKRVLELAILEARALDVNYVGSEHLLLAMINSGDGLGMVILDKFKKNQASINKSLQNIKKKLICQKSKQKTTKIHLINTKNKKRFIEKVQILQILKA